MQTPLTSTDTTTTEPDPWGRVSSRAVHPSSHSGEEPLVSVIAAGLAAVSMPWELTGETSPTERTYELLLATDTYDAWLIHWPVGTGLEAHDHGGSTGAFAVVSGVLDEDIERDGLAVTCRVRAGQSDRLLRGSRARGGEPRCHWGDQRARVLAAAQLDELLPRVGGRRLRGRSGRPGLRVGVDRAMSAATERLLTAARSRISTVDAPEAFRLQGDGATLVEHAGRATRRARRDRGRRGRGAQRPRWRLDPAGEHRLADIDHDRPIVVFCQEGYASSLAVASLVDLGLTDVHDLAGGYAAWVRAGLPTCRGGSDSAGGWWRRRGRRR